MNRAVKVRENMPFFQFHAYMYDVSKKDTGCKRKEERRKEKSQVCIRVT